MNIAGIISTGICDEDGLGKPGQVQTALLALSRMGGERSGTRGTGELLFNWMKFSSS